MSIRSILVVKPSSMGDIVHTLPAVARVRRGWPQARLKWLVNPEWAPLLEGNPDVDEIVLFPRRELGGVRNVFKQIRWLRNLRAAHRCDLVLDFQGLLRSALAGRACRGGELAGLSDAREGARFFYDRTVRMDGAPLHAVERYLRLADAILETGPGAAEEPLSWKLPEGSRPGEFDADEPFLLLHPFSRGAGKSLSVEDVESFCRALPFPVVLAGRSGIETGPLDRLGNVVNLLNRTTLPELIWLIRRARFVVSVDSGPMHIAAALARPLLAIHTWSDPARVGPYLPDAWVWKDRLLFQVREIGNRAEKRRTAPDLKAVAAFVAERIGVA